MFAVLRLLSLSPATASALRHRRTAVLSSSHHPRKPPPSKHLLKSKETVKNNSISTLSTAGAAPDPRRLLPNQAIALVAASQANFMRVIVESAPASPETPRVGRELLCVVRALLKKIRRRVMVGDRVFVGSIDWVDRRGMIEDVFERRSEIMDPPVANVDRLLVLFSLEQPRPEEFTMTRFLVEAESTGIPVTLVLNKMELVDNETVTTWKEKLSSWGYKPLFCSVETKSGLSSLEDILRRQTTVIVGPSGVGKSSLINTLRGTANLSDDEEMNNLIELYERSTWLGEQRVGTVSKRSGRGKHTTRHVSLLPLTGGGFLADTPGFNQPSLSKVTKKTLAETFPEIRQMLNAGETEKCAFNDCLHVGEPGCIVKGGWERYPYYLQLLDEIKVREELELRMYGTKREGDVRYKVREMGVKQAEPRLELKKHRRVSRKRINQSILDDVDDDDLEEYWSEAEHR